MSPQLVGLANPEIGPARRLDDCSFRTPRCRAPAQERAGIISTPRLPNAAALSGAGAAKRLSTWSIMNARLESGSSSRDGTRESIGTGGAAPGGRQKRGKEASIACR